VKKIFKRVQNKRQVAHEILKEAFHEAFFTPPFRIIGIITDGLTGKALFKVKIKKVTMRIEISTQKIIELDSYFVRG
jgi:hypothetical protein